MLGIQKPSIKIVESNDTKGAFSIEPLERGLGYTLGNSMRRILLSSIPGAAVTSVKISGAKHEHSTLTGVREDTIDILLNIKGLIIKLEDEEPAKIKLKASGEKKVTAGDIEAPTGVEILNPKHYLSSLNKKGKIEMEMTVEKGRGYATSEENEKGDEPIGVIPVDSVFSPVLNVTYRVENTRVGQRTDFDKMTLFVTTDGSLTPEEAVSIGASILVEHVSLLAGLSEEREATTVFEPTEVPEATGLDAPVGELDLNVRAYNCLQRVKIETLSDLVSHTEEELIGIRNLGAKTVELIKEKLISRGLSLRESE